MITCTSIYKVYQERYPEPLSTQVDETTRREEFKNSVMAGLCYALNNPNNDAYRRVIEANYGEQHE